MRILLALCLLAAVAAPAYAQAPAQRSYAAVSMVGDRMMLVNRALRTGSSLDRNERAWIEVKDTVLDETLAEAIYDAIHAREPQARIGIMMMRDPSMLAAQNRLLEQGEGTERLVQALKPFLDRVPATHVVLASKVRHEAMLAIEGGHVGSGRLEGLGFYMDRTMRPIRDRSEEPARGFLGAFAYFKVSLVDVQRREVVREQVVTASVTRFAEEAGANHPWDAMTSAEKIAALQKLLKEEAARAVPALLP